MSKTNPDIRAILENDKRVLTSDFYTSPSALPPLEIHFLAENGLFLLSNQHDYVLTSVAGYGECMKSAPQDNSGREDTTTQGKLDATVHALESNIAHTGSISPRVCKKGKKCQRTLLGGVQGNRSDMRSPNVATLIRRAKEKQAQQAGSSDANYSSPEEVSDQSPQEGRDREVEPCMFPCGSVQHFF